MQKIEMLLLAVLLTWSGTGKAQDDFFDAYSEDPESQEGLQSATPTDSVNELNTGNGNFNVFSENNSGGESNFPAADDEGGFNVNSGEETGNEFFTNEQNGAGGNNQGGQINQQTIPENVNNAPLQQANPLQQAVPQQTPVQQQVPVNAQSLMNQISTNPAANGVVLPVAGNEFPVEDPAVVTTATGEEALLPSTPEQAIDAPPLPPPNEFAGSPPVPGTMRLLAESEAPEEYLVQRGDTLFDICDQLLDEPAYWPKLWALNPEIKNPHFIFPNMKLRFYPGDDETPPYLQVVTEEEVIPIEKGDLDEQELIAEKVIFEEEGDLGASLTPTEVIGLDQVEEITDMVLGSGKRYRSDEVRVQVPGFIFGEEKEAEGFVVTGRNGENSVGPGMKVVVESAGGISAGTLYSVLRPGEKVRDPETNDFIGYKYYFVGNVRVTKALNDDLFMGVVENNRMTIMPDDMIVNFISTFRTVPISSSVGSSSTLDSTVVGFEFYNQEIGGQGGFAFISKGSGDGVSPGMYISVYGNPGYLTADFGKSKLPKDREFVGIMRVIDTTEAGSVGYIVRNVKEFRIGDRTDKG